MTLDRNRWQRACSLVGLATEREGFLALGESPMPRRTITNLRPGPLSLGWQLVILMAIFGEPLAAEEPQAGRPVSMQQHETTFGRMPDGAEVGFSPVQPVG